MNSISNTDLDTIFQNTSTKKKNTKELPTFKNACDPCQGTLNRSNPQSLHLNLLDSLTDYPKNKPYKSRPVNDKANDKGHEKDNLTRSNNIPSRKTIPRATQEVKSKPNVFEKLITNIESKSNTESTQLPESSTSIPEASSNNLVETFNSENNYHLQLHLCPNNELHQILYCLCSAILPEFASYPLDLRNRSFKTIREKLAYDLDEKDLYQVYAYRKKFNKITIQSLLLSQKPITDSWFLLYLSDYFNINICRINENLVFLTSEYKNQPTLFLHTKNRNVGIYAHQGNALHSASLGKEICQRAGYVMQDFKVISKYKLDELQQIATSLNIDLKDGGVSGSSKIKNKKKDVLYNEIKNRLNSW